MFPRKAVAYSFLAMHAFDIWSSYVLFTAGKAWEANPAVEPVWRAIVYGGRVVEGLALLWVFGLVWLALVLSGMSAAARLRNMGRGGRVLAAIMYAVYAVMLGIKLYVCANNAWIMLATAR